MINWCKYEWLQRERWGQVHPDKPDWWYDPCASYVDSDDILHLTTKKNPKYFNETGKVSEIGIGLVSCTTKFGFGEFKIEAKLPYGHNLWPAFWMWSWDSWPPEIDVFEGYSDDNPNYFKFRLLNPFSFWNIQTNLHFTDNGKNNFSGAKNHYFGFKDPTKHWIEYSVEWMPSIIKFYYGGKLVRKINDRKVLNQLNSTTMNVVINNGVTSGVDLDKENFSDFMVKKFEYNKY